VTQTFTESAARLGKKYATLPIRFFDAVPHVWGRLSFFLSWIGLVRIRHQPEKNHCVPTVRTIFFKLEHQQNLIGLNVLLVFVFVAIEEIV
jgi:hypothetical protein